MYRNKIDYNKCWTCEANSQRTLDVDGAKMLKKNQMVK